MTNVKSDRWGLCEERGYPEMGDWVLRSLYIHEGLELICQAWRAGARSNAISEEQR